MSFETKFVAPAAVAARLVARLRHHVARDPEHGDDRVHSVYFEGPDDDAADEVANGDLHKTKIRVRWYASTGPAVAFAECKRKLGGQRGKLRVPIADIDPNRPLQHPSWREAAQVVRRQEGGIATADLTPALHLVYRRRRFVHRRTGLRLAVDDDIRIAAVHPRLAGSTPPLGRPADRLVFEVKGSSRRLPPELGWVHDLGLRRSAFSKYGLCRGIG
ncbi:MAG: VTC domain-containing protein [Planctomycetes bacterium]|nr:VTC domain-containing protein [Planctomycetota bacterium]